jgi:hypothetical protein
VKALVFQAAILVLGAVAIWLLSLKDERLRRWGYIVGLTSQPFWLFVTFKAGQWGMCALSVWYTYSWCQGIWNFWLRRA